MLAISRQMNLIIPIDRDDGTKLYIHALPIDTTTFEKFYLVLARCFSAYIDNGIVVTSAPSIAYMMLKEVASQTMRSGGMNWWDGEGGVNGPGGLMDEIVRRCSVIVGGELKPLQDVINAKQLLEDEKQEILSELTFFTVVSRVPPRADRDKLIRGLVSIYNLQLTSLKPMDFLNSLKTSISADATGTNKEA